MNRDILRVLPAISISTLILAGAAAYVGLQVINQIHPGLFWRMPAWTLMVIPVVFLPILLLMNAAGTGRGAERLLVYVYFVLGLFSFLFVFTAARDLVWISLRGIDALSRLFGAADNFLWPAVLPPAGGARQLWVQHSSVLVMGTSLVLFSIGMIQALLPPKVVDVDIPVENLHPDLEGFQIVQLSDIHLGPLKNGAALARVVERVNALTPDLVAITGDLVDGSVKKLGKDAQALAGISAPVFFVNGNHETYWNPVAWASHLETIGIKVLLKERQVVCKKNASLHIWGDGSLKRDGRKEISPVIPRTKPSENSGGPDTSGEPDTSGADFRLLLAHQPGAAYRAAGAGFDLQLSGHTHGGQFFPWNLLIDRLQPFARGLYRHRGMWIYTSRGTGFWGPPVRLGAPQEITQLTLGNGPVPDSFL